MNTLKLALILKARDEKNNQEALERKDELEIETETENSQNNQQKGSKLFNIYFKILNIIPTIVFWFNTYSGFGIYTFFSLSVLISPFYGLTASICLKKFLNIFGVIIQMIVGYPLFELEFLLPFGNYKQILVGKLGVQPLSPLHMALNTLYRAKENYESDKKKSIVVFAIWTIVDSFLLLVFIFYTMEKLWAILFMFVLACVPAIFCMIHVLYIFGLSWYTMFCPIQETLTVDSTDEGQQKDDENKGWPFLKYWEKYIRDNNTEPIRSVFKWSDDAWSILITFILWIFLIITNVILLIGYGIGPYLVSAILNVVLLPFYLRFNIFKIFAAKEKLSTHKELYKISRLSFLAAVCGVSLYIVFTIVIGFYSKGAPVIYNPKYHNITYPPVAINSEEEILMPMYCSRKLSGYNVFEMMMLAAASYAIPEGEESVGNYLELGFGSNWTKRLKIDKFSNKIYGAFFTLLDNEKNSTLISIKGDSSYSDTMFSYALHILYNIPENFFKAIPNAPIAIETLVPLLVEINPFFLRIFDPVQIYKIYSRDIFSSAKNSTYNERVLFAGHSSGGGIAKSFNTNKYKVFALNSPMIHMWMRLQSKDPAQSFSGIYNLDTVGHGFRGIEKGSSSSFMPYRNFDIIASINEMICLTSLQCSQKERFEEFCHQTVDKEMYEEMKNTYF